MRRFDFSNGERRRRSLFFVHSVLVASAPQTMMRRAFDSSWLERLVRCVLWFLIKLSEIIHSLAPCDWLKHILYLNEADDCRRYLKRNANKHAERKNVFFMQIYAKHKMCLLMTVDRLSAERSQLFEWTIKPLRHSFVFISGWSDGHVLTLTRLFSPRTFRSSQCSVEWSGTF